MFGPETANASDHAGAVSFGDARLLLFPVRSLCGVFVWTTSVAVLSRYARDLTAVGIKGFPVIPPAPGTSKTSASNWGAISAGDKAVLEEYCFTHHVEGDDATRLIAEWLAEYALPATDEYAHFRTELQRRLVVLSEDEFRDFTQFATEVVTRVHLDAETKTVMSGQLWTEEMLPAETLLYAPLHFTKGRPKNDKKPSGKEIATALRKMSPDRLQLGGDETVGPRQARAFLESLGVEESVVAHVENIVAHISFKGGNHEQAFRSPELDVVQDADRLDALGAIGIARAFAYGGHKGRELYNPAIPPNLNMTKEEYKRSAAPTINHFYEKLLLLKDRMNTATGRAMAERRHLFMETYLEEFYREWEGEE